MRILVICSGNSLSGEFIFKNNQSFIYEQAESLIYLNYKYDTFFIKGKGVLGYLKNYTSLRKKIKDYKPDIVHAHYGLSALLAVLQRKAPVVTTFHGTDVNNKKNRLYSRVASILSKECIFVNSSQPSKISYKGDMNIVPCGVDTDIFYPVDKRIARQELNLVVGKNYALFASAFSNEVKNYPLAKSAIELYQGDIELIALKGYSRKQVALLLNAVDFVLMTSFSEGSPQIIKEAMACNCPIISVDVGDVKNVISSTDRCFIVPYSPESIALQISKLCSNTKRTSGRDNIQHLTLHNIAIEVVDIYRKALTE